MRSNKEQMHIFGLRPKIHAASNQMTVSTATGELDLYDLGSVRLKRQYNFPASVIYERFSPDGKRLFVLTRDQTAFTLDLTVDAEVIDTAAQR